MKDSKVDANDTNICSKFDEYLKKYEEFNKQVNKYL